MPRAKLPAGLIGVAELSFAYRAPSRDVAPLDAPSAAAAFCRRLFPEHAGQERIVAVALDNHLRPIGWYLVSVGTVNASLTHPRDIFRAACILNAASVVVSHNHPSGDTTPSRNDDALTARLRRAGDIISITLMDHVIIGDAYYSYREHGTLEPAGEDDL